MKLRRVLLVSLLSTALVACAASTPLSSNQQALVDAAKQGGVTDIVARARKDGGLQLSGKLEGRQFALVVPQDWNHQAMLFEHGYTPPGTPLDVPVDPMKGDADQQGVFRTPYAQGFLVGHSSYDKAGISVESAVVNTHRLKDLARKLGATKTYLIGASMGGNIVEELLDRYPHEFAGAVAGCGAVGSWEGEIGWMADVRGAYNYFAKGTKYELPGEKSIAKSALSSPAFGPLRMWNMRRIAMPVYALFEHAEKEPNGQAAKIIDNVAAASATEKDPAAFVLPILTSALGMDDVRATFGGNIFDNTAKVYHSPLLSEEANAKLNAGFERVKADPRAVANADVFKASGHLGDPLLSIYNSTDPLVPSPIHETILHDAVVAAGTEDKLLQRPLPPMTGPMMLTKLQGLAHCGFTERQVATAWNDLLKWSQTGQKPAR